MAEKNPSQVQQFWNDQMSRLKLAQEQSAKWESEWATQMTAMIDQTAALTKQSLAYFNQLSAEVRKMASDMAPKA